MSRLETTVTRLRKLMSKVFVLSCKKASRFDGQVRRGGEVEANRISNMEDLERGERLASPVYFFAKYRGEVGSSSSGSNVTGIVNISKSFSCFLSFLLF